MRRIFGEHKRAVWQQLAAWFRDHFDVVQRLGIDALDELGELQRLLRRHRVPVHHVQRISGLPHVQAGKRAPRSADRIKLRPARPFKIGSSSSAATTILRAFFNECDAYRRARDRRREASRRSQSRRREPRPIRASRRPGRPRFRPGRYMLAITRARRVAPRACRKGLRWRCGRPSPPHG